MKLSACGKKSIIINCSQIVSVNVKEWTSSFCGQFHQHFMSAFAPIFLRQTSSNLKCRYKKSFAQNFRTKKAHANCWWNWHQDSLYPNVLTSAAVESTLKPLIFHCKSNDEERDRATVKNLQNRILFFKHCKLTDFWNNLYFTNSSIIVQSWLI